MKAVVSLAIAIALVLVACGAERKPAPDSAAPAPVKETPIAVQVAAVEDRERAQALLLDGSLTADEQSDVTSVVPGRVREVLIERGSVVEKDQPLVRLRDLDYRLSAQAAHAQLEQARARLGMQPDAAPPAPDALPDVQAARTAMELAARNEERAVELAERGVLTAASLDEARARAESAREQYASAVNGARATLASLEAASVALRQAKTSASEATVRAPFAGEIADRKVSVGEYVGPQTPLLTLVRTDPLRIQIEVPQRELRAVQPGQRIEVSVDAVPDRRFEGTVRYVSAAVAQNSRALTVEAVVPNPDRLLRPGLFATARLYTGGTETVHVVPAKALFTSAGVSRVFVVEDGRIRERVVTVSARVGDEVLLSDGPDGGAQVAVDQLDRLSDGVMVTPASTMAHNQR